MAGDRITSPVFRRTCGVLVGTAPGVRVIPSVEVLIGAPSTALGVAPQSRLRAGRVIKALARLLRRDVHADLIADWSAARLPPRSVPTSVTLASGGRGSRAKASSAVSSIRCCITSIVGRARTVRARRRTHQRFVADGEVIDPVRRVEPNRTIPTAVQHVSASHHAALKAHWFAVRFAGATSSTVAFSHARRRNPWPCRARPTIEVTAQPSGERTLSLKRRCGLAARSLLAVWLPRRARHGHRQPCDARSMLPPKGSAVDDPRPRSAVLEAAPRTSPLVRTWPRGAP